MEDLVQYITDAFSKEKANIDALKEGNSSSRIVVKANNEECFEMPKYLKKNNEDKNTNISAIIPSNNKPF